MLVGVLVLVAGARLAGADPDLDALEDQLDAAHALAILQELLESASDDGTDLVEALLRDAAALRAEPLDLNTASFSDLVRVPFLDGATAAAIVARREVLGPFGSLDELAGFAGIGREDVRALRPYLFVSPPAGVSAPAPGPAVGPETRRLDWSLRMSASCRLEELEEAGGDLVDAARTRLRLRASGPRGLALGLGCERDALESSFLDHSVFYLSWDRQESGTPAVPPHDYEFFVIAGDFVGLWGQGIVLSGSGFPSSHGLPKRRDRLRGYDGASESAARRGIVVQVSRGRARVAAVGARTRLDAAIDERGRATAIRSSGYHRTAGERRGANALGESLLAVRAVVAAGPGCEIGASVLHFRYDSTLASGDLERRHFQFEGSELEVRAMDLRATVGSWRFGAEAASTSDGGRAALACARARQGRATVRFGFGYLSRRYWSPLGGGIPGFSGGGNGIAGWVGAAYRIAPRTEFWIDLTVAGRPWRSYFDELPGGFRSWSGGIEFPAGRLGDLTVEMRSRAAGSTRGDPPASVEEVSGRTRATFRAGGGSPFSFFAEKLSSSAEGAEEASSFAFGARGEIELSRTVSLAAGLTQVARSGGARPIVQYEPGLPGEFGLRSLSQSGARWYARLVAGLSPRYGLSLRIGGGPGRGCSEFGIAIDTRG